MDRGRLYFEFSTIGMWRPKVASPGVIATGDVSIVVETLFAGPPGSPAEVVSSVDGTEIGRANVPVTVPLGFSATETFDVGMDLGSAVALEYFERAPFTFEGTVKRVHVAYL